MVRHRGRSEHRAIWLGLVGRHGERPRARDDRAVDLADSVNNGGAFCTAVGPSFRALGWVESMPFLGSIFSISNRLPRFCLMRCARAPMPPEYDADAECPQRVRNSSSPDV